MIRIAVVDDENLICVQMESNLLKLAKKSNIRVEIDVLYSGNALCKELQNNKKYDVIFLDIEMDDMNGIEASNFIRNTMKNDGVMIVYVSGKTQYAMDLFQFSPLDFITKPIQKQRFMDVWRKIVRILGKNNFFSYKKGREVIRVNLNDIIFFENDGRKILMVTNNETDSFNYSMKEIEIQLKSVGFICIHRSYLINYNHVRRFTCNTVIMSNGQELWISKDKREEVRNIQLQIESGDIIDD